MEDEEIIDDEAFKILIRSYIPDCIFDESYESPHVIFAYNNGVKDENGFLFTVNVFLKLKSIIILLYLIFQNSVILNFTH